jgi:pimeloyl-ACP methyl ester carboxylesterase
VLASSEYGAPDGAQILGLHGALGTKERFERIGTEGLPERRWLALDLRGFGDSVRLPPWTIEQCAEDVLATLDALGSRRPISSGPRSVVASRSRPPDPRPASSLSAPGYVFETFDAGTFTVSYSAPCLTGPTARPLHVAAGEAICIGAGAH